MNFIRAAVIIVAVCVSDMYSEDINLSVSWSDTVRKVKYVNSGPNTVRFKCEHRTPYMKTLVIIDLSNNYPMSHSKSQTIIPEEFSSRTKVQTEKDEVILENVPRNRSYRYWCEYKNGLRQLQTPGHCIQDVRLPTCGLEVDSLPEVYSEWQSETYVFYDGQRKTCNLTCKASERFYLFVEDKHLSVTDEARTANDIRNILDHLKSVTPLSGVTIHNCTTEKYWCFVLEMILKQPNTGKFKSSLNVQCVDINRTVLLQTTIVVAPKPSFNAADGKNNVTFSSRNSVNISLCEITNVNQLQEFGFKVITHLKVGRKDVSVLPRYVKKYIQVINSNLVIKENEDNTLQKLLNKAEKVTKEIILLSDIDGRIAVIQRWKCSVDLPEYPIAPTDLWFLLPLLIIPAAVIAAIIASFVCKYRREKRNKKRDDPESQLTNHKNHKTPPMSGDDEDPKIPPMSGDAGNHKIPPMSGDAGNHKIPVMSGDAGNHEIPPMSGDDEDLKIPLLHSDAENQKTPPMCGDAENHKIPPMSGDAGNHKIPPMSGDAGNHKIPPMCGDAENHKIPPMSGDDEDLKIPLLHNDAENQKTPPICGDAENHKIPLLPGDDKNSGADPNSDDNGAEVDNGPLPKFIEKPRRRRRHSSSSSVP